MVQLHRWILGCLSVASILSGHSTAWPQELSFRERYALSENRQELLAELIPDTDAYYYYHCLLAQTTGKTTEARGHLDAWIAKVGLNDQTRRMQTRQYLLEYSNNPQATIRYLISEFGIHTEHPAPRKNEAADLETSLNPNLIQWDSILRSHVGDVNWVESMAWGSATPYLDNPQQLRHWLERVQRPDTPKLLELIERELKMHDSRGFGWASIHQQLTESQLIELQKRIPKLAESNAYVQSRLRRIRPSDDASLDDPSVMRAHLDSLEKYTLILPESQNSLKANILFRRLEFDERSGNFDRERFLRYLSLPVSRPFANAVYLAKSARQTQADLNANFVGETLLRPIVNEQRLVQRYLEHFAIADVSLDAFAMYLDRDYLQRTFAAARILQGVGDAKAQYAKLSPDEQRELQSRIEVEFDVSNPLHFKTADAVQLKLNVKNVPELLLKIYRVNARNLLALQKRNVSTDIDLDGLVANVEKRLTFTHPADRRHMESIDLPELAGGGIWVVDALAGGMRSRAMIHKGHLHALQSRSDAGDVLRVFDADGKHLTHARALYGNRELEPNDRGEIIVPFSRDGKTDQLILIDGPIATLQNFQHSQESYSLRAGFLVDPQSLLAGAQASIVVRPNLLCNGELISLAQLEKPILTITATDRDGIASTQTLKDLSLADSKELVKKFIVPPRLANLQFSLVGEVLLLSNDSRVTVSATHAVTLQDASRSRSIHDFYLSQTDQGYFLEVRGRNGEPAARMPVQLEIKLFGLSATTSVRLATNDQGIVSLGPLADVQWIKASAETVSHREFSLPFAIDRFPEAYHAVQGEAIEFAVSTNGSRSKLTMFEMSKDATTIARYSLLELRGDAVYAIHSDKVLVANGLIRIQGLQAGNYRLTDHASGQSVRIAVVQGERQATSLVSDSRIIDTNRVRPVHVSKVSLDKDKLTIQIGNYDPFVRVHLIANAYVPTESLYGRLPAPSMPLSTLNRTRLPSFYLNSMKLDEEYQYVLQRQLTKKYLGSLLPHPSALLTPWEIATTQNATKDATAGDALSQNAPAAAAPGMPGLAKKNEESSVPTDNQEFEFLKRGSVLLDNLECDASGILALNRQSLQGLTSITVLVVHPSGSVYHALAAPSDDARDSAPKRDLVDLRLAKSFPATEKWMQSQNVRVLSGSDKTDLGAAATTRVQTYSSIPEVFQLYRTILRNSNDFDKLDCLSRWGNLQLSDKQFHYSELECHEVNLFLSQHDKPFFERVVRPFLANKMQKQFMDDYLLDHDLSKYVQPWRLGQMNAVERILLAKRLTNTTARTQRWMRDWIAANPTRMELDVARFATALEREMVSVDEAAVPMDYRDSLMRLSESRGLLRIEQLSRSDPQEAAKQKADKYFMEMDFAKDGKAMDAPMDEKKSQFGAGAALGRAFQGNARRNARLGKEVRLYETLETTRKWAESNYFLLALQNQNANLIKPSAFWLDFLDHSGDKPFLTKHLDQPIANVHEAVMALAVLGLPLESGRIEIQIESNRLFALNGDNTVAFIRGLETISDGAVKTPVLANHTIVLASETNETAIAISDKPLVTSTVYRSRLVLTNPTSNAIQLQVLQQIPQGAIALDHAKATRGQTISIAPFATQEINTYFYFPKTGEFSHYGTQVAVDGKSIIALASSSLRVLDAPESTDESAWSHVAMWGSNAQVLERLKSENLSKINLEWIAWRLSDKRFFEECLNQISECGIYQASLWAYAFKHNDSKRMKEYLDESSSVIARVGSGFRCSIIDVDPVDRFVYEHFDFRPLIVARTHLLGAKRVILNDGLAQQYERLMQILEHQSEIDSSQRLALTYYLLIQNRFDESISQFSKINREQVAMKLQYDCFMTHIDWIEGRWDAAESRAKNYEDYPVPRWRDWFAQVRSQSAERKALIASTVTASLPREDWKTHSTTGILTGARESRNASESDSQPALDVVQEGDKVVVRYRNLNNISIHYYLMDVEHLFSRNPFAQQDGGRLNTIEPNGSEIRELKSTATMAEYAIALPEKWKNKNFAIEVVGGGLTKQCIVYANSLTVQMASNMGRVQVLTKQGLQPLAGAYVKVYVRTLSGQTKFYKDGYTDLRGQFEYASLSTNDLDETQRFAILVIHPEHGTLVREADPPKR